MITARDEHWAEALDRLDAAGRVTAQRIYDGPVQELLAAGQDIEEWASSCPRGSLARAAASIASARELLRDILACASPETAEGRNASCPAALQLLTAATQRAVSAADRLDRVVFALDCVDGGTPPEEESRIVTWAVALLRAAADQLHPLAHDHGGLALALENLLANQVGNAPEAPARVVVRGHYDRQTENLVVALVRDVLLGHWRSDTVVIDIATARRGLTLQAHGQPCEGAATTDSAIAAARLRVAACQGRLRVGRTASAFTKLELRLPAAQLIDVEAAGCPC